MFFHSKATKQDLAQLAQEVAGLKREFNALLQEWDATSHRVTKVLRRIRTAEEAQDREVKEEFVEGSAGLQPSTIPTPPDRLTRIREQLQARGKNGGK